MYSARLLCSSSSDHGRSVAPFSKTLAPKMPRSGSGKFIGADHCLRGIQTLISKQWHLMCADQMQASDTQKES